MPSASSRRRPGRRVLLTAALLLPALLSLLGWTASYFYNMFNSDVTMPDWTVELTLFAAEILPALRTAVLLAFVACFSRAREPMGRILTVIACGILANLLFGLASTWLSEGFGLINPLTLLTDLVLCAAAFFIAKAVKRKADAAGTPRERKKWSMGKTAVFAALPAAIPPVIYASLDLAEHFGNRNAYAADVWASGTAFFTGVLVRRILIWGALGALAAWLTASLILRIASRAGRNASSEG